ncbi:MAG: nucleotidyltransferase domain-containing protein [Phycisphaerae bacterium]
MRDIRAFARRIAKEFRPKRIILFGSYAYGTPTDDSDVDLMVVFGGRGSAQKRALEIVLALDYPGFALDLLTRNSSEIRQRVQLNDWFIMEIIANGTNLYEA